MGCTHYSRNQAAVNALASQWISLQDEIKADFVGAESDGHGVLGQTGYYPRHADFLTRGGTENAERYCETQQKFRRVIQNKRLGMLSAGIVLLHDNARPHTTRRFVYLLQEFSWEVFNYPTYSPDFEPSDFHLFLHLKNFLSGQCPHFQNDREGEMNVTYCFQFQAADF